MAVQAPSGVGPLVRDWRERRHLSQLDLALEAGVSTRHLSFVETGRSRPSRRMVMRLAERLDVPLRERNALLLAAGHAPVYDRRPLDSPELSAVREALQMALDGHEPYPAMVVDRAWNLVAANRAIDVFFEGVAPRLLEPPINAIRLALHPDGLVPRVANLNELRAYLLGHLRRLDALTGDQAVAALHEEVLGYPGADGAAAAADSSPSGFAIPVRLRTASAELALFSTIATFGSAIDVTVAELSIESFFPADAATAEALRARATR